MKQFNDDELTDLVPAKPPQAQTAPQQQAAPPQAQPAPAPPQQQQARPAPVLDDDIPTGPPPQHGARAAAAAKEPPGEGVEWGDSGVMTGEGRLERIRPEKGSNKVVRLALLPFLGNPRGLRSHYVLTKEGKRQYVCLGTVQGRAFILGPCCKQLDEEGRYHLVNLAVQYTNSDTVLDPKSGNYSKGYAGPIEFKVGYVDLSRTNFRQISNLVEEGNSIYDYDLAMVLSGNKYDFFVKSRTPRWKSTPELAAAVEAAAQAFVQDGGRKLFGRLGKRASLLEWKALLSNVAAGAAEASLDTMDDIG